MWLSLTKMSVPGLELVIRGVVVYVAVLVLLRISGKRQVGQMSATEFVAVMLISNAVQNAMNAGDNSLTGGLLLAVVLIIVSYGISMLTYRSVKARVLFEGTPTILIHKGKLVAKNLRHERITPSELKSLLRRQGVHHFHEIHTAILESDGSLSLTRITDMNSPPPEIIHDIDASLGAG